MSNIHTELAEARRKMLALQAEQAAYWRVQCEGSREWSPMDSKVDAAIRRVTQLEQQIRDSEWTREVFEERKADWNKFVTDNADKIKKNYGLIVDRERAQGWTLKELQAAKARLSVTA